MTEGIKSQMKEENFNDFGTSSYFVFMDNSCRHQSVLGDYGIYKGG